MKKINHDDLVIGNLYYTYFEDRYSYPTGKENTFFYCAGLPERIMYNHPIMYLGTLHHPSHRVLYSNRIGYVVAGATFIEIKENGK